MTDFKGIKKQINDMMDHWEKKPGFRFILDDLNNEFVRTGHHYATSECIDGTCGYPRIWFGKCIGMYKDAVMGARLRKVYK